MVNETQEAVNRGIEQGLRRARYKEYASQLKGVPRRAIEDWKKSITKTANKEEAYAQKALATAQTKRLSQEYSTRKPAHLKRGYRSQVTKGAMGLFKALVPNETASASSDGNSGRGRGRPTQSFKYQIPGVGPVPIQAFKRYISQQKAMARLQRELAISRAGQMPPPDHVRGNFNAPDETDRFLTEDSTMDQMAQQQFAQQQMNPQQMQQQGRRFSAASFINGARNLLGGQQQQQGISLMGSQQQRFAQPQYPGQRNPALLDIWGRREDNILNVPNIFNRPRADGRLPLV
jgi:hypothetical protein